MDKEQRTKITTNLTFLKDRLGFLDPILDRLIEKNVISIEQREKIESVYPSTQHKKFNEFISILLASPSPIAFQSFVNALEEERYYNITERLMKEVSGSRSNSRGGVLQPKETRIGLGPQPTSQSGKPVDNGRSPAQVECRPGSVDMYRSRTDSPSRGHSESVQMATLNRMFSDLTGKLTNDLLEGFEKQRQQERMEQERNFERKRQEDKFEFEMKMEQKIQSLRFEFEDAKKSLERNDKVILELQERVTEYKNSTDSYTIMKDRYEELQREYDHLGKKYRQLQKTYENVKESEQQRFEGLRAAKKENRNLQSENDCLKGHVEDMTGTISQLKKEKNEIQAKLNDQHDIELLLAEKEDLQKELEKTKSQVTDLWQCVDKQGKEIDSQAKEIERLMAVEHEKCAKDNKEYEETLKRQNERLEELFEVVRDLKDRQAKFKPTIMQKQIRQINKPKN